MPSSVPHQDRGPVTTSCKKRSMVAGMPSSPSIRNGVASSPATPACFRPPGAAGRRGIHVVDCDWVALEEPPISPVALLSLLGQPSLRKRRHHSLRWRQDSLHDTNSFGKKRDSRADLAPARCVYSRPYSSAAKTTVPPRLGTKADGHVGSCFVSRKDIMYASKWNGRQIDQPAFYG